MTGTGEHRQPRVASDNLILGVVAAYAAAFVVFGFLVQPPASVLRGLSAILTTRDALLTGLAVPAPTGRITMAQRHHGADHAMQCGERIADRKRTRIR